MITSSSCGVTYPVRVLEEGRTEITASLGGPVVELGGYKVPLPLSSAGISYGYSHDITFSGAIHLTAFLFGNAGIEGAAAFRLNSGQQSFSELTAQVKGYFFSDIRRGGKNSRFFPMLTLNSSHRLGKSIIAYYGADNLYQFHQPQFYFSPFAGIDFPVRGSIRAQCEIKWLAMNINTAHGVFEGTGSINSSGNLGIFFGVNYLW